MEKYNRKEIMRRAWEIKFQDKNYVFGECLKIAWAEAKTPKKVSTKRTINRTIPYSTYKNGAEWCETAGVIIEKGAYHAEDKTIDIIITTKPYFLKDEKCYKVNKEALKVAAERFIKAPDKNIIFFGEAQRMAVDNGVSDINLTYFFNVGTDLELQEEINKSSGNKLKMLSTIKEINDKYFIIG